MGLYQVVHAVAFLTVFIIYHGVAEIINVPAGLPYRRVHKYSGIDTHYIVLHLCHALPPVFADVTLQLHTILAVIIYRTQPIIYFARLEYKTIFFAMPYYILQCILVCHRSQKYF